MIAGAKAPQPRKKSRSRSPSTHLSLHQTVEAVVLRKSAPGLILTIDRNTKGLLPNHHDLPLNSRQTVKIVQLKPLKFALASDYGRITGVKLETKTRETEPRSASP